MKHTARLTPGLIILILVVLLLLNLTALYVLGWPVLQDRGFPITASGAGADPKSSPNPSGVPPQNATATLADPNLPSSTPVPLQMEDPKSFEDLKTQGVLLLYLRDGEFSHLFAYHPDLLPLTRLTSDSWDEITPAISPDGARLAYSSHQNGYWNLYIRDLTTGQTEEITNTQEYEGSPTWSPDGQWLAYEAYRNGNLDIYLQSLVDLTQAPIQLTEDLSTDSSPSWSPRGRQIAFVSNRTGDPEIWIADLDKSDNRFTNVSHNAEANDERPVWSKDGRYLAWASEEEGDHRLMTWDSQNPPTAPAMVGYGDLPAWSPNGDVLYTALSEPQQTGLAAYRLDTGRLRMAQLDLPGEVYGMVWKSASLSGWLLDRINAADTAAHPPLVETAPSAVEGALDGRQTMVNLQDVTAPVPMIHQSVIAPFQALRLEAARLSGWDVLSSLENAYIPLSTPYEPSLRDDWLYTGRAFALNPLIMSAGWMTLVREDYNGQTYWRIYLKARFQDGTMGVPLDRPVWDMNARFTGDPKAYEQGGQLGGIPNGYWVDLTELASRYGWERLPSQVNWRTFYPGIRYNQFVVRGGLDWNAAMAQIYPPEALATPTSVPTYTNTPTFTLVPPTPTRTPRPSITPSPTRTPTVTLIPNGGQ
jgi:TolB protein